MKTLPPLRALVAFEAAFRLGSFLAAAKELHLTPGAVGQQVRKLEEWLGIGLFNRQVRKLTPTDAGLAYYRNVAAALQQIAQATSSLRDQEGGEVWLSTSPGLAGKWLGPRIARFIERHPEINLHISASTRLANFDSDRVDLAIRYFDGHDPRLNVELLYRDEVRLYASPEYRDRVGLQGPDDLRRATLIHTTLHPHWAVWGQRFTRIPEAEWRGLRRVHFDQSALALEAAKAGQGVVLANPLLTADDLSSGQLVELFDDRLPLATGYFLVARRHAALRPGAAALRDWLLAEFAAFAASARVATAAAGEG